MVQSSLSHSLNSPQNEGDFSNFFVSMAEDTLHYRCLALGRNSQGANAILLWVKYSRNFQNKAFSTPTQREQRAYSCTD